MFDRCFAETKKWTSMVTKIRNQCSHRKQSTVEVILKTDTKTERRSVKRIETELPYLTEWCLSSKKLVRVKHLQASEKLNYLY